MIKIVEKKNPILGEYDNGNYHVTIYEDGTKVRYNNQYTLIPQFPESIDCKISRYY